MKETAKETEVEAEKQRVVAPVANDAKEFHPEFEQYEGATLDDNEMGFAFDSAGVVENKEQHPKPFMLDDFDDSSSEDDNMLGKIGIAPASKRAPPKVR